MKINEAMHIIGVSAGDDKKEIRKKYRTLIAKVHPDNDGAQKKYPFTAADVNAAYELLLKEDTKIRTSATEKNTFAAKQKKKTTVWNALENPNAYASRPVYQYVHDAEGMVLGEICVAKGRYFWILEEDFPLFLKSVYQCGKRLLEAVDEEKDRGSSDAFLHYHARLTYLLTQQYIDAPKTLEKLAISVKEEEGKYVFQLKAMIEGLKRSEKFVPGEYILPKRLQDHKLYVQNMKGRELGYISFVDDRLYWVVIPLFEARRVLLKMQAAAEGPARGKNYLPVDLWIQYDPLKTGTFLEDLNGAIGRVLSDYGMSS